jgi:peptide deformylase
MGLLDIIKYGDTNYAKLRSNNVDVKKENPFLQQLIDDMFETLDYHKNSVGLAAPQVGKTLNLFVIKTPTFKEVFINPEIQLEGLDIQVKEGCLSFPNIDFAVNRRERVQIKFFDRNWTYRYAEYKELIAIIVQHEYNHLKGKLIID